MSSFSSCAAWLRGGLFMLAALIGAASAYAQPTASAAPVQAAVLAPSPAPAVSYYGFDFPGQIRVAGQHLLLNGVGGRSVPVIFMRVFAAALYLPERSSHPETIVSMAGAKRVEIRMNYGVDAVEFKKALVHGIEKNYSTEQQAVLAPRINAFAAIIDSFVKVKRGDVIAMDFLPRTGLVVSVNGQVKGQPIAGEDFYAAVLRIFIGERPAEKEMKARMLGLQK